MKSADFFALGSGHLLSTATIFSDLLAACLPGGAPWILGLKASEQEKGSTAIYSSVFSAKCSAIRLLLDP